MLINSILTIISVAFLWLTAFYINQWLFAFSFFSQFASWIFIPASVRIFAILIWRKEGCAGLFLGALCLNIYKGLNIDEAITLAFLSSIGPLVAINLYFNFFEIDNNLAKLKGKDLLGISIFAALVSSTIHSLYFMTRLNNFSDHFLVMLIGDSIGTFLILVLACFSLKLFDEYDKNLNRIS